MKKLLSLIPVLGLLTMLAAPTSAQEAPRVIKSSLRSSTNCYETPHYGSRRVWVPGYYETRTERVFVPERTRREWVPARYREIVLPCGRIERVLVAPGHWTTVCEPAHYTTRERRVWVPGRYEYRGGRRSIRRSRRVRLR